MAEKDDLKNIKVTPEVKEFLDRKGNKGETYDQILRRLLKIKGRYGELEEKIKKCAEGIVKWERTDLPNDYRNLAKMIFNVGYDNDDVEIYIDEFQKGWGDALCYRVNKVTFAKLFPQYNSIIVKRLSLKDDKPRLMGTITLKDREDFTLHYPNNYHDNIREAYQLAKSIGAQIGDKYLQLIEEVDALEESLKEIREQIKDDTE